MKKGNESILNLLVAAPWWVSPVLAGVAFLILRYVLPGISVDSFVLKEAFARTAPVIAPLVAFFLLIPAPLSAYHSWRKRKLLDSRNSLESIRSLSWKEFEELVGEAYRRQGYTVRENPDAGPDGGIDIVLKKDGNTVLVQCKQWHSWKVGVKVVREMYGLLTAKRAHAAIIITSGMFTQEAKNFATGKPLDLVEGKQLADLVASVQKNAIPSSPNSASIANSTEKLCPKCGARMVIKTARKGKYAGSKFWACSNFPRCRGLLPFKDTDE